MEIEHPYKPGEAHSRIAIAPMQYVRKHLTDYGADLSEVMPDRLGEQGILAVDSVAIDRTIERMTLQQSTAE